MTTIQEYMERCHVDYSQALTDLLRLYFQGEIELMLDVYDHEYHLLYSRHFALGFSQLDSKAYRFDFSYRVKEAQS